MVIIVGFFLMLKKKQVYFELGVSSCGLVMLTLDEIWVFSQVRTYETYGVNTDADVIDEIMGVQLPITDIF